MDRIQIALAEILIKRDMLIFFTYRNIRKKYNVVERTLRYYVRKYGDQQPRFDKFFTQMNSHTSFPSRTHIREMIYDLKQYSEKCAIFNKFHDDKKEREEEMDEGAMAGDETCYEQFIREQEEIRIANLQDKWNKEYLRKSEELQIEIEDLYDLENLVLGNF